MRCKIEMFFEMWTKRLENENKLNLGIKHNFNLKISEFFDENER
jgi:hypothetical protein